MNFIDAHCHLYDHDFDKDRDEIIKNAKETGVKGLILVAESTQDYPKILELSRKYEGVCFAGLGLHPVQDETRSVTEKELFEASPVIEQYMDELCCIGEVGLDHTPRFCNSQDDKEQQEIVLTAQVELSKKFNLPLNVHSRSAARETVRILKEAGAEKVLLHNFAGKPSVALQAVQCGFCMSFPPNIANKQERTKLLQQIPLDNILLETDSPCLGPEKGVRNVPANISLACQHIAKVKKISAEEMAAAAWANTLRLFPKLQSCFT